MAVLEKGLANSSNGWWEVERDFRLHFQKCIQLGKWGKDAATRRAAEAHLEGGTLMTVAIAMVAAS